MPWGRIDENAMEHPKFLALSDGAWRLWCQAMLYCQRYLTDGFVPQEALSGFRYFSSKRKDMLLKPLVYGKAALWHEVAGGVQLHDYLDHNDSREKVIRKRQEAKDRLSKHREKKRVSDHTEETLPTTLPVHDTLDSINQNLGNRRRSGHPKSHLFCGNNFCVSERQLETVLQELGPKRDLFGDPLTVFREWDATNPFIDNLLPWLKKHAVERVGAAARVVQAEKTWTSVWDICEHVPKCQGISEHQAKLAKVAV